ncbi:Fc.00g025100.m01.CDS01 [Cosmosporella sp. VM-42]
MHSFEGSGSLDQLFLGTEAVSDNSSSHDEFHGVTLAMSLDAARLSPQTALDQLASQAFGMDLFLHAKGVSPTYSGTLGSAGSARSLYHRNSAARRDHRHRRQPNNWSQGSTTSPSSFDADYSMMARSNSHLISENLLGIYHDVLEHNLSCWLIEDTCPYKMKQLARPRYRKISLDSSSAGIIPEGAATSAEWGSNWSNRIYHRVIKLDQVARATKMIQLTPAEDRLVSRALRLAVMAFASQWAQGNRQRESYSSATSDSPNPEDFADELAEEFDRNLQRSMWEQAKRALQDVSDLECYRVVCAELIFGLTQKPWASDEYSPNVFSTSGSNNGGFKSVKASILPQIIDIISKDGPPVYLEKATRKIHALKFRFDATQTKFMENDAQGAKAFHTMSMEDRRTIGLLYWLAVMFDTVSSSMNERPVAVADGDCQHDAANEKSPQKTTTAVKIHQPSQRWEVDLFIQDNPEAPSLSLQWPCSYEAAARAVTRSAPVKVLLFRHVSYFQNALRKGELGQPVEDVIQSTTLLYRYWNITYGTFFRELVKNYDSVPPRIQSWFVVISSHWHLAALMLADLIDFVDHNELGLEGFSQTRLKTNITARIRKASAAELSDLARVATPAGDGDFGDAKARELPNFHFAVNAGTLLTEPWTIILIRAFAKAAILHLGVVEDLRQHEWDTLGHDSEDLQESLRRSEECIRGLWFLGRKSDMARDIARVLGTVNRKLMAGKKVV